MELWIGNENHSLSLYAYVGGFGNASHMTIMYTDQIDIALN